MSILTQLKKSIETLKSDIVGIEKRKISPSARKKDSLIFSKRQENYQLNSTEASVKKLIDDAWKIASLKNRSIILSILNNVYELEDAFSNNNFSKMKSILNNIEKLSLNLSEPVVEKTSYPLPRTLNLPPVIKDEVIADLNELRNCFEHGLYRSSIILCGRILEIALHRKYYETTKKDILETNPGIGLGKLVAKLYEKKVLFDPGINEQIHLINKIRIHSVHKKQDLFKTSKEQTYATILYTLDIVKRLFG